MTDPASTTNASYQFRTWNETVPHTSTYIWPAVFELFKSAPSDASVLDAGCGNGAFTARLAERGFSVTGIDLSESGIQHATERNSKARFVLKSIYDDTRDLNPNGFDYVVYLEVIEHLYDPKQFAANLAASLRPGGTLILSTPYHGWLKNVVLAVIGRMDKHWQPAEIGGHIKFWSPATLAALLREEGLTVTKTIGVGRLPWLWMSMVIVARKPA